MDTILGTLITVLLVGAACFFAVRSLLKDKKAGKSISCGGNCKNCAGCSIHNKK